MNYLTFFICDFQLQDVRKKHGFFKGHAQNIQIAMIIVLNQDMQNMEENVLDLFLIKVIP